MNVKHPVEHPPWCGTMAAHSGVNNGDAFFARLERRAVESGSLVCVGLDPHPELLESPSPAAARRFCLDLIARCAPYACAIKPNSAFFEALGAEGWAVLREVIAAVPDGIPVILDAKRGDIASTAQSYARAVFDVLGCDALTVSPYLGHDSLEPFLSRPDRGAFVLCKSSNPGSDELQSLLLAGGEPLYLEVARRFGATHNAGLVVGATDAWALARVRSVAPDAWFLVPGVGAQGGDLEAALAAGLRADGLGVLIAVSRSLAIAADPAAAAAALRDAINQARNGMGTSTAEKGIPVDANTRLLASSLWQAGCVRVGRFTLKSGRQSSLYLDLRRLASHPPALRVAGHCLAQLLRPLQFDRLAAVPYAALPISTAAALEGGWPLIFPRREAKGYGTGAVVEGTYQAGETVAVIDDLITTGESKLETIIKLEAAGLTVRDVVVLVDRSWLGTAGRDLEAAGYRLHAVAALPELLRAWRETLRVMTTDEFQAVSDELAGGNEAP